MTTVEEKAERATPSLWLASRGTRHAFPVGLALLFAIPLLLVGYILLGRFGLEDQLPPQLEIVIILAVPCFVALGYSLLRRYPENILRLRGFLQETVRKEVPEAEMLISTEDDMRAIEDSLNLLLGTLREKVTQSRRDAEALSRRLEAEKTVVDTMDETDRAKDLFVESIAKELNAPVTPIRSALQLFLDGSLGALTPEQTEILGLMQRNMDTIARLSSDILAFSQGQGATTLSITHTALNSNVSSGGDAHGKSG